MTQTPTKATGAYANFPNVIDAVPFCEILIELV